MWKGSGRIWNWAVASEHCLCLYIFRWMWSLLQLGQSFCKAPQSWPADASIITNILLLIFPHFKGGCEWKMSLGLLDVYILWEGLEKEEFFVIIIKYGNVQEMTCGFIHTITVAKASRVSKNTYTDSRQICFTDIGRNLSQIGGRTPINFRRVRISLPGSEMHFCDVLSILSWHQVNSWRKEVTQPLQNWVLHP